MLEQTEGWKDGWKDGRKDRQKGGMTDRPYFIGPFLLLSGVQYVLKRTVSKSLKVNFFFLSNLVPFNGQDYEKQKCLELVTNDSPGYKIKSEKFLY